MRPGLPSPSDGGSPKMGWIGCDFLGLGAASAYAGLHMACVYGAHVTSSSKLLARHALARRLRSLGFAIRNRALQALLENICDGFPL